jgi:hypothetical protein
MNTIPLQVLKQIFDHLPKGNINRLPLAFVSKIFAQFIEQDKLMIVDSYKITEALGLWYLKQGFPNPYLLGELAYRGELALLKIFNTNPKESFDIIPEAVRGNQMEVVKSFNKFSPCDLGAAIRYGRMDMIDLIFPLVISQDYEFAQPICFDVKLWSNSKRYICTKLSLINSVRSGNLECVKWLTSKYPDWQKAGPEMFFEAAQHGFISILKFIDEYSIPSYGMFWGEAIGIAIQYRQLETVKFLVGDNCSYSWYSFIEPRTTVGMPLFQWIWSLDRNWLSIAAHSTKEDVIAWHSPNVVDDSECYDEILSKMKWLYDNGCEELFRDLPSDY